MTHPIPASPPSKPWHGIMVATALPLHDDLSVDHDAYAEHVRWLVDNGCDGVVPNGSLGEYQTLTDEERARGRAHRRRGGAATAAVMPGVAAYGSAEAAALGRAGRARPARRPVLLLPPNAYRADERIVAGPLRRGRQGRACRSWRTTTRTTPRSTSRPNCSPSCTRTGHIVAVKEFSGDVRRAYEIAELAPASTCSSARTTCLLELAVAGAVGWIAGIPERLPRARASRCTDAAVAGDLATALPLYRTLHPLLRWDSKTEFVQAIKLSMDIVGPARRPVPARRACRSRPSTRPAYEPRPSRRVADRRSPAGPPPALAGRASR